MVDATMVHLLAHEWAMFAQPNIFLEPIQERCVPPLRTTVLKQRMPPCLNPSKGLMILRRSLKNTIRRSSHC